MGVLYLFTFLIIYPTFRAISQGVARGQILPLAIDFSGGLHVSECTYHNVQNQQLMYKPIAAPHIISDITQGLPILSFRVLLNCIFSVISYVWRTLAQYRCYYRAVQ